MEGEGRRRKVGEKEKERGREVQRKDTVARYFVENWLLT